MRYLATFSLIFLLGIATSFDFAVGQTSLGTGNGALVGNDLTDLGNDGSEGAYAPPNLAGFDAEFFSSNEPGFGGGEFAFNVFDNVTGGGNNKWCCGANAGTPQIVGARNFSFLGADEAISLTSFTLTSSNDSPPRDPRVWTLEGSNDTTDGLDGTWTAIYQRTDGATSDWSSRNEVLEYSDATDGFLTDEAFTAFRLNTEATGATSGAFFALGEFELFGDVVSTAAVPEPTSVAIWSLIGLCLAGFGYSRIRRKK